MRKSSSRVLFAAAVVVLAFGQTSRAGDVPDFALGFASCPATINGLEGTMFSQEFVATLATSANPSATDGAQGWSISIAATGVMISAITTANTAGAPAPVGFQQGGFEKTEITATGPNPASCPGGRDGAVSAVVLSFTLPITLPAADNTQNIARLTADGIFPDEGTCVDATVEFIDNCRGSGQPVGNRVTWMGNTVIPTNGVCNFMVCGVVPPPICPNPDANLQVIIQSENTNHVVGDPFATGNPPGLAPTPDPEQPAEVVATPGPATVYAGIVSQLSPEGVGGVQGWSLALSVKGDIELTGVTIAGTAAATVPVGLQNGGFEKTETVNPLLDPATGMPATSPELAQGPGAVTAVVLSFTLPITLGPDSTGTVLCINVQGDDGDSGQVCWRDGMRGSGQPVRNVATVNGETREYVCCQRVNITFQAPQVSDYIRCDPNNDGKNDIADAVWIVNELFRGGPATACPAAADCDSQDGMTTLNDAIFCVNYQFRGGSAPAAPFPDCGGREGLSSPAQCPSGSTSCP
jgi:hypothetical protein